MILDEPHASTTSHGSKFATSSAARDLYEQIKLEHADKAATASTPPITNDTVVPDVIDSEALSDGPHEESASRFPAPDDVNGQIVTISISHDGDQCVAVAIAPIEPLVGDVGGEAAARGYGASGGTSNSLEA